MMDKKSIFERSAETNWLVAALEEVKPNEVITYDELSQACGEDVRGKGRGALASARRILERESQKVFGAVRNEGLKCLDDPGIVNTLDDTVNRIRNHARRGRRRSVCVQAPGNLNSEERRKFLSRQGYLAFIEAASKSKKMRSLESKVEKTNKELDMHALLEAFKGD